MSRTDEHIVSLAIRDPATGEVRNLGEWDKMTGGELDSEESVYNEAGGRRRVLGGRQTPGNVTLSRLYDLVRDHSNVGWLLALAGRGTAIISKQPTSGAYVATGRPLVYTGRLKRVNPPEVDSDATDPGMLELEFTIDGPPKLV